MLDYNVYQNGKRIGFTPNASFIVQKSSSLKNGKFAGQAVFFAGNESGLSTVVSD